MSTNNANISMAQAPAEGRVSLRVDGAVAHILFDRPAARNAMTWAMYEGLAQACAQIQANPNVRVAVFRGAGGKAFVAGTDIEQFKTFSDGAQGIEYERNVARFVQAVADLNVPTVAVVEGWAVGGGMALASVCDIRVATRGARFGVPIARTLGNCLAIGNLRLLVDMLGPAMTRRMLLLADIVNAEELTAGGYLLAVVAAAELDAVVAQLCERLAGHAPVTMSVTKQSLRRLAATPNPDDRDLITACYAGADFHEGVAAFVDKRAPVWRGSHQVGAAAGQEFIVRSHRPGDIGWVIQRHGQLYAHEYGWDETFEGFVAQIAGEFLQKFDPTREHCWIAEKDGHNVASVFLVRESDDVAKLRMLIVDPQARGLGIGKQLVDQCIAFARTNGYRKLTLWTNDVLVPARRIYQDAGFTLVKEEQHRSFGQDLVGQNWELQL